MPRLDLHGTQVEYQEQGRGTTVVLLHSSASSSAQWRELIGQLSERYRVIAPDLHGYGRTSAWAGRGSFRLEHEAKLVEVRSRLAELTALERELSASLAYLDACGTSCTPELTPTSCAQCDRHADGDRHAEEHHSDLISGALV